MNVLAAAGRGVRDWFLFGLIATGLFLIYVFASEALAGRDANVGAAASFGPAIAFYGAFLSIPGLIAHRVWVRRLERRAPVRRSQIVARAPIILVADLWWIVWEALANRPATAATEAALVLVTSLVYAAVVPRRDRPAAGSKFG